MIDSKTQFATFLSALAPKLGLRRTRGTWHTLPSGRSVRVGGGGRFYNVTCPLEDEAAVTATLAAMGLPIKQRFGWAVTHVRLHVERDDWKTAGAPPVPATPTKPRRSSAEVAAERKAKAERARVRDEADEVKSRTYYAAMDLYRGNGHVPAEQDGMWWSQAQVKEIKKLQQTLLDGLRTAGLL